MKTHIITKEQIDTENNYIGEVNLSDFDGNIEAIESLGYVKFQFLKTKGYIWFKAGSGIEAGWGIKAGEGIEAGWGIKAGSGIKAGEGIEAGSGIKAGEGIEAGSGIKAGLSIQAKFIFSKLRIFAGICLWRLPSTEEKQIRVQEVRKGEICYGDLVILSGDPSK